MMEVEEIRNHTNFLSISYNPETKVLDIDSALNVNIIDRNFNELEERLNELNGKINRIMFNYTKLT